MSDVVISVENLSKIYRLGEVGTGSLAHDVNRWWHRIRGKEDPYLKIGQVNDRTKSTESRLKAHEPSTEWVYALKDVSFHVKRGEVLGVIGRNGAGKSTLLKILSRVTTQTTGQIKVKGRIASLLEVGTGFHPELTGRENIFLNGAILGMRKREIASKLDEIVEFSGCARYIDTPVKRYSSGMYVRLAFSVAAHLDPEILIVDEVLAVGDTEFQKKCLGKMSSVAKEGRTVLFVSHNMAAVQRLCSTGILIATGRLEIHDTVDRCIKSYQDESANPPQLFNNFENTKQDSHDGFKFKTIQIENNDGSPVERISVAQDIALSIEFTLKDPIKSLTLGFAIRTLDEAPIFATHNNDFGNSYNLTPGTYKVKVPLKPNYLRPGQYDISLGAIATGQHLAYIHHALRIEVDAVTVDPNHIIDNRIGAIFIPYKWPDFPSQR